MERIKITALALLLALAGSSAQVRIPGPGGAGVAAVSPPYIKGCNNRDFANTSLTCVFGSNVASTSLLVVQGATVTTTTVSISGCSATWTTTTLNAAGATVFKSTGVPASGACTITATLGASVAVNIMAAEYGPTTGGLDNTVALASQGVIVSGNPINCPAITTAVAHDRVVCIMQDTGLNSGTYTAGSGFTIDEQAAPGQLTESQDKAAAGSVTPTATYNATTTIVTASVAIKP